MLFFLEWVGKFSALFGIILQKVMEGKSKHGECNACSKVVMCSGNTTNLISHLRLNHSAIYAEVHPKHSKKGKPKSSSTSVRGLLAEDDSNTRDSIVSSQGSDTGKSIIHHYFLVFTL